MRADTYIESGSAWARRKGIPNHKFSVSRVGDHVHVVNKMFDMQHLAAIVRQSPPRTGYVCEVIETSVCPLCEPDAPPPCTTPSQAVRWDSSTGECACGKFVSRVGRHPDYRWVHGL